MNPTADTQSLRGLRAIIVEDSFAVAESLDWLLTSYGCQVVGKAANVRKGVLLATRPDYDVAILDVRLGNDLATDVARTVQQQGKRIVYLTGYADLSLLPHELSDYPVLPKPLRPDVLVEILSEA